MTLKNAQEADCLQKFLENTEDFDIKDIKKQGYTVSFKIDEDSKDDLDDIKKPKFTSIPLKKPGV